MNKVIYDNKTDRFLETCEETKFSLLTACLHVGYKCNLACPYCFNQFSGETIEDKGDLAIFSAIKELGIKRLVISGGEPFLYQERLFSLLKTAKDNGVSTLVSTNGVLLNDSIIEKFLPYFNFVDVSLPATNAQDYYKIRRFDGFQKVILTIKKLIENNVKVRLTVTVSKDNFNSLKDLPSLVKDLGVKNVRIGYEYNENGLIDQLFDLTKVIKELENEGVLVYKPIEDEKLKAYKEGYVILRLDGNSYLESPKKENFITNVLGKTKEDLKKDFTKIAKEQRKLFCE